MVAFQDFKEGLKRKWETAGLIVCSFLFFSPVLLEFVGSASIYLYDFDASVFIANLQVNHLPFVSIGLGLLRGV